MTIRLPENAVLRGRDLRIGAGSMGLGDLNMTVGGTLRLRKSPGDQAGIVGAVEVVRGFYEFQGRRFTVGRGSAVRFRGNELTNPVLDVTGEREVSGVTALVRVAGTAQRPVLSLSSRPALAESDVLALIVFNQPLNQLGTSQQADLLERAGDIALGALASSLTESIGRALDVDLFEIRAPTAGEAGEVALGTQVNERVFIGVRQEFGASEISRVSIEYRISEALRLLTSVAQGSGAARGRTAEVAGIDFVYTVKY
jgi:translocation and assembly module TamB